MKKSILMLSLLTIIVAGFVGIFYLRHRNRSSDTHRVTIGILQTASHPALDAAREGFVQQVQSILKDQADFVIQNAQGSVTNAHTIAQSFKARNDIDAIFAIATPAAKAIASIEKEKPIVIAAVTDPNAIGLIHPTTNVAGSSDMVNVTDLVTLVTSLVPQAKRVGILFNTSEINSVVLVNNIEKQLTKVGLIPSRIGMTSEAELAGAVESGLKNNDVIVTPTDNTVASAIDFIAGHALRAQKPLIVSDNLLVKHGALAAQGVDYKKSGAQAADSIIQILRDKKKPYEIPLATPEKSNIFVNQATLDTLGLSIPESLADTVQLINTK